LNEPFVLKPEDSGTEKCPIAYVAYRDEKPIISGGRPITGWRKTEVKGKKEWEVTLPKVAGGKWYFRQMWIAGQRRFRARYPKKGYLKVAGGIDPGQRQDGDVNLPFEIRLQGQASFRFHHGNLKSWSTLTNAEIIIASLWAESRLPLLAIDEQENIVTLGKKSIWRIDPDDLYYVENIYDALTSPGEWYLDRETGRLFYLPLAGEEMDGIDIIAPFLVQTLRLEGKPEIGIFVENIIFRGITFAHTKWELPSDKSGFVQAAFGVPGSIYGEGVRHCMFEKCTIKNIGNYGLELSKGCDNNQIVGCEIFDTGGGGIKIGETAIRECETERTGSNRVTDCHIHGGGKMFFSSVGVWIGQSHRNKISNNHIHDYYYSGISIGWTWGYGPALAGDNVIENNHVHNIGVLSDGDGPILSDMAGIYTLGVQPGTVIRSNIFHDIAGYKYGGFGIYLDEGSSGILVAKNTVYRTTHAGFHLHFGKENVVRNNIFAFGRDEQIRHSRSENHRSFTFEKNIVYWRQGILLYGMFSVRRWICLTPGVAEGGMESKKPALFKKFILTKGNLEGKSVIGIPKLKRPVDIDGHLDDWKDIRPIRIQDQKITPEDLSADIYLGWDEENLYFATQVRDNVHWNTVPAERMYMEDSVTIAMDSLNDSKKGKRGYGRDDYELGFALTKNGPQSYCWVAPREKEKEIVGATQLQIKREGIYTNYEAAIPLKNLGLEPERIFGFNVVVFDSYPGGCFFDRNIYFKMGKRTTSAAENLSWEEWQKAGMDTHSLIADPLFINPEKGDFRLKPDSPVFKIMGWKC